MMIALLFLELLKKVPLPPGIIGLKLEDTSYFSRLMYSLKKILVQLKEKRLT